MIYTAVDPLLLLRQDIQQIAKAALRAVDSQHLVQDWLEHNLIDTQQLLAVGKAAAPMARGAFATLGGQLERGLVIIPDGYDDDVPSSLTRIITAHPLPDARSLDAGQIVYEEVRAAGPGARWLGLWSGGASAALERLVAGVTLEDLRQVTALSMRAGEPIAALQERRLALSSLKGGQLAELSGAHWNNLVLSDVRGDDPARVGGGPTVRSGDGTVVLGTLHHALHAARAEAFALRYATVILDPELCGEAREAGHQLGQAVRASVGGPPMALLLGGEPVVSGVPEGAIGGRMQELALSVALAIEDLPAVVLALATDGRDGTSPPQTSGALIDGHTAKRLRAAQIDVEMHLARHDSYRALDAVGAIFRLQQTRTNVRDLVVALIAPV